MDFRWISHGFHHFPMDFPMDFPMAFPGFRLGHSFGHRASAPSERPCPSASSPRRSRREDDRGDGDLRRPGRAGRRDS